MERREVRGCGFDCSGTRVVGSGVCRDARIASAARVVSLSTIVYNVVEAILSTLIGVLVIGSTIIAALVGNLGFVWATITGLFAFGYFPQEALSGPQAAALFLTAPLMVLVPDYGISIFGIVSAACFFLPGLKYYRQARKG